MATADVRRGAGERRVQLDDAGIMDELCIGAESNRAFE
jgi:hypothetical protein